MCLSASHRNADFDTLERLSPADDSLTTRLLDAHGAVHGAVVVSTCNRFETYLDVDESRAHDATLAAAGLIERSRGFEPTALDSRLARFAGEDATRHLFSVTAGLESVVVGEGEIAGQVRRALEQARTRGTTTPELERAFQRASAAARAIKNETELQSAGRNLVRLSLELASFRVTDWGQARVLMIGTGNYAAATLTALREHGARDISVASLTGREGAFADKHDLKPVSATELAVAAARADLVIACTTTATGESVLDARTLGAARGEELLRTRELTVIPPRSCPVAALARVDCGVEAPGRRQLFIDLGMPRNIAADIVDVPGVELLDLHTISLHTSSSTPVTAEEDARELLARALDDYTRDRAELHVAPAIVALRDRVHGMLDDELSRLRGIDQPASAETERALKRFASRLLHDPTVRAKAGARDGRAEEVLLALRVLFGIES